MSENLRDAALVYHEQPKPGKLAISATKPLTTQRDLALAYSPGVAAPCEEIARDPLAVAKYTSRNNLIAVITNGTAVLGLGDIGALASKPVMEGNAGVGFQPRCNRGRERRRTARCRDRRPAPLRCQIRVSKD